MRTYDLHQNKKSVSILKLPSKNSSTVNSIRISAGNSLKAKINAVPSLLIVQSGQLDYQDKFGQQFEMGPGDYHQLLPNAEYCVTAQIESFLLLVVN